MAKRYQLTPLPFKGLSVSVCQLDSRNSIRFIKLSLQKIPWASRRTFWDCRLNLWTWNIGLSTFVSRHV